MPSKKDYYTELAALIVKENIKTIDKLLDKFKKKSTSIVEGRILKVNGDNTYCVNIFNSTDDIYDLKSCNDTIYKKQDKVWVVIPEGNKKKMFIMGKVV